MVVQSKYFREDRAGNNNVENFVKGRARKRGLVRSSACEIPPKSLFRIATLNMGTMRGRSSEVVETVSRRGIDLCCMQEVRWRGASARFITGKDDRYKFFWVGSNAETGGVGILLAEKWVEKVFDVNRVSDRILLFKLLVGETIITVLSVYAPQSGLDQSTKDAFYDDLQSVMSKVKDQKFLIPCGDWNGHIGQMAEGYKGVHGGKVYGERNIEGKRLFEFASSFELVVTNSFFCKRKSHLVTFHSGNNQSQIDYILVRKRDFRYVRDVKVIPGEECALQHKLLTCDLKLTFKNPTPKPFVPKRRVWKLRDPVLQSDFCGRVGTLLASCDTLPTDPDSVWDVLKTTLLKTTEEVCGWTRRKNFRKDTWWWDDSISKVVGEKRRVWKVWKKGKASKEEYLVAKRASKHAVYSAKKVAEEKKFDCIKERDSGIFKIFKQMKRGNQDVVGEKCVLDDNENLCFDTAAKSNALKEHYSCLLNQEFVWDQSSLSTVHPVVGPAPLVSVDMVYDSVKKMKAGKAAGPTGVVSEMLIAGGESCMKVVADLINSIIRDRKVPKDWEESYIINLYEGKGDALVRGNYRGLKLLEHVMKVLERVVEIKIRSSTTIDDMQFGFMPGRGTTDAIFIVRQWLEKLLAKNKNLYLAFVDLEKAFDRVPRQILWWAMRKLGIDE